MERRPGYLGTARFTKRSCQGVTRPSTAANGWHVGASVTTVENMIKFRKVRADDLNVPGISSGSWPNYGVSVDHGALQAA